jgi:hypothetical protein
MGEGFAAEPGSVRAEARERERLETWMPLRQWRASSAVDPPRSISNRDVKRGSADGTGGSLAGSVGPCAHTNHNIEK